LTAPEARERKRLAKQRERERKRKQAVIAALALAERTEQNNEHLAPQNMRNAITSANNRIILGARVHIVNGRPVRSAPIGTLSDPIADRGAKSLKLSTSARRAARELQRDWSDVGAGLTSGVANLMSDGHGGQSGKPPGHDAMLAQIEARRRLEAAITYMGAFTPGVVRIVIDCIPVATWATEVGKPYPDACAWLEAGLSRLAGFYWPATPVRRGVVEILTIGPARADYSLSDG
jgi:hypothetical protein